MKESHNGILAQSEEVLRSAAVPESLISEIVEHWIQSDQATVTTHANGSTPLETNFVGYY